MLTGADIVLLSLAIGLTTQKETSIGDLILLATLYTCLLIWR